MTEPLPAELVNSFQRVACLINSRTLREKLAGSRILVTADNDWINGYRVACGNECSVWEYAAPEGSHVLRSTMLACQMTQDSVRQLLESTWPESMTMSDFEYAFRIRARTETPSECDSLVKWLSEPIEFKFKGILATHIESCAPDPASTQDNVFIQPKFELVRAGLNPILVETRKVNEFNNLIDLNWLYENNPHFVDLRKRLAAAWPEILETKKDLIAKKSAKLVNKGREDFARVFLKTIEDFWPENERLPESEELAELMTKALNAYNRGSWKWDALMRDGAWSSDARSALWEMTKVVARHEHKGEGIALAAIPLLQVYSTMNE